MLDMIGFICVVGLFLCYYEMVGCKEYAVSGGEVLFVSSLTY